MDESKALRKLATRLLRLLTEVSSEQIVRLLDFRLMKFQCNSLPPRKETKIFCCLTTNPGHPIGLVENDIKGDTRVAVTATVCRPGNKSRTIVKSINVTVQPEELGTDSLFGTLIPFEEKQISEDASMGSWAGIQNGQAQELCSRAKQQQKARQLPTSYALAFINGKSDVRKTY